MSDRFYVKKSQVKAHQLSEKEYPEWLNREFEEESIVLAQVLSNGKKSYAVKTLEGIVHCTEDDYICQGIVGEVWPVRYDIFEKTYTLVGGE